MHATALPRLILSAALVALGACDGSDVGGNWVFTSLTKVYGAAGVAYRRPVLSPDGRKIVFASEADDASGEIYVMNADGAGLRRLTTGMDANPSWSPDGRRIAFASYRGGQAGSLVHDRERREAQAAHRSHPQRGPAFLQPLTQARTNG